MARRGSYAKGVARREEILESALDVIGRKGYQNASLKEIAEVTGVSENTVKSRMRYALESLRRSLAELGVEGDMAGEAYTVAR